MNSKPWAPQSPGTHRYKLRAPRHDHPAAPALDFFNTASAAKTQCDINDFEVVYAKPAEQAAKQTDEIHIRDSHSQVTLTVAPATHKTRWAYGLSTSAN